MNSYIALLRGINVSGQKKIKMAELREHLADLGFQNLQTYIQSGNIVFQSDNSNPNDLEQMISSKILEKYNFEVPVVIRTLQQLKTVYDNNPFAQDPQNDVKQFYVVFLADLPKSENILTLEEVDYSPEAFVLDGLTVYLYVPNGAARAKMNNNLFEKKLKVRATTRNWRTVKKLIDMSQLFLS